MARFRDPPALQASAGHTVREIRYRLGLALVKANRLTDAASELGQCLQEPGDIPSAAALYVAIGRVLERQGELLAALMQYVRGARSDAGNGEAIEEALKLVLRDDLEGRDELTVPSDLATALALTARQTRSPQAALLAGLLLAKADQGNEAQHCLKEAASAGDERVRAFALAALADLLGAEGKAEESLHVADQGRGLIRRRRRLLKLGFRGRGGGDAAWTRLAVARAKALVQLGRYGDALRAVNEMADTARQLEEVTAIRAAVQVASGQAEKALATLAALSLAPTNVEVELWRAVALLLLSRYQETSEACDAATGLDPSHPASLLLKAQALIESATSGEGSAVRTGIEEGRRLLTAVVNETSRVGMAAPFFEAQRRTRAHESSFQYVEAELVHARDGDPRPLLDSIDLSKTPIHLDAAIAWLRAEASANAGDTEEAAAAFESASDEYERIEGIDPGLVIELLQRASYLADPDGRRSLRLVDKLVQQFYDRGAKDSAILQDALKWFGRWATADPESVPVWAFSLRGQLARDEARFLSLGIVEELWKAVAVTEAGESFGPDDAYRWVHLSISYGALGLSCAASQAVDRAIELNDHDPWIRYHLLISSLSRGSYKQAQEVIPTIIDDPTYATELRTIALYIDSLTSDDPSVLTDLDKASQEYESDWFALLHANVTLRYRGLEAARPLLEKVVRLVSGNNLELGREIIAKALLGDLNGARQLLTKAEQVGNILAIDAMLCRWVIELLSDEIEDGIRSFYSWLAAETNTGWLDYVLKLQLPYLIEVSTRHELLEVVQRLLQAGRDRLLKLQTDPPPWIADLDTMDDGRWSRAARVLARRRFGKAPEPSEVREVGEVLATQLPRSAIEAVVRIL